MNISRVVNDILQKHRGEKTIIEETAVSTIAIPIIFIQKVLAIPILTDSNLLITEQ
jgi:hypothetical protein